MIWPRVRASVLLILAGVSFLSGCGGGGGGGEASVPAGQAGALAWDPPQTYADNSPLDPFKDIDYYEIYVRTDPDFTDGDLPVAQVSAVTEILSPDGKYSTQSLTSLFDLANLEPFRPQASRCYLSVRAVGVDGLRSGFAGPVVWDHTS